ncbi:MAG: thioesterase II family protein, partial [Nannocystaceae bacterium]
MVGNSKRWLQYFGPERPEARVNLVGFAFAGSGASIFARWQALAPAWLRVVGVALPGRENRHQEPSVCTIADMVDPIVHALTSLDGKPFVLYGHSLGAVLAYEVVRKLGPIGRVPSHLFVAVRRAPHLPRPHAQMHKLDDDAFISAMG